MKKILKNSRHIRWNWERSPDDFELVRYHFIVVDDKNRNGKVILILESLQKQIDPNYSFSRIRSVEGKVAGTEFRYLFESYDTLYSPGLLNLSKLFKNTIKDKELYERKNGNIEDYVSNLYG